MMCTGSLFPTVSCFTDTQIFPKCIFTLIMVGIMGSVLSIMFIVKKRIVWNFRIICIIVTILCSVEAGVGILQFCNILPLISSFYKVTGSFDNPAGFAGCLCAGIPFSLYLFRKSVKKLQYISGIFPFFIILFGIILSESRAGLLSVIVVLLVHSIYQYRKKVVLCRNIVLFSFIICLSVSILFSILYYKKKDSADGRLLIWKCTWEMMQTTPIAGNGIDCFHKNYMDYQANYFKQHPDSRFVMLADNVKHPFNEYLLIGVQFGIIGWILLIGMITFLLFCYRRQPMKEKYISLLALLSIAVFSFFSYPFTYPFVWIVTITCIVTIISGVYSGVHIENSILRYSMGLIFFIVSLFGLYIVGERIKSELDWQQTLELSMSGERDQALQQYAMFMERLGDNPYFLYNYAAELYKNGEYEKCLNIARQCRRYWADYDLELIQAGACIELNLLDKAEKYLEKAKMMCPIRFMPIYELMKLYQINGEEEKAKQMAKEIIKKPIKISSYKVNQIKEEARKLLEL